MAYEYLAIVFIWIVSSDPIASQDANSNSFLANWRKMNQSTTVSDEEPTSTSSEQLPFKNINSFRGDHVEDPKQTTLKKWERPPTKSKVEHDANSNWFLVNWQKVEQLTTVSDEEPTSTSSEQLPFKNINSFRGDHVKDPQQTKKWARPPIETKVEQVTQVIDSSTLTSTVGDVNINKTKPNQNGNNIIYLIIIIGLIGAVIVLLCMNIKPIRQTGSYSMDPLLNGRSEVAD